MTFAGGPRSRLIVSPDSHDGFPGSLAVLLSDCSAKLLWMFDPLARGAPSVLICSGVERSDSYLRSPSRSCALLALGTACQVSWIRSAKAFQNDEVYSMAAESDLEWLGEAN
ncbi:hypothetical protein E4U61_000616 [Claviceps capensis]|nr:hypothetical protein E4U61_000616 [Claviceps capensis]